MKFGLFKSGLFRAYWLGSVVCIGGFLFGYDSGIIGGVLTFVSFERDFGTDPSNQSRTNSLAVGLQNLGAFIGCFLAWPMTGRWGRRKPLMLYSLVFIVGVTIQTIKTESIAAFYVGRVVAGLGLGASTVIIPMFNSEMVPKELRGQIGSFFQLFFTLGIFTSYWIDYGVSFMSDKSTAQWQIPVSIQLVPAALLGLGMFTIEESARWLTMKGRHEEAWRSLSWIRCSESEETRNELEEIRLGVEEEFRETEGFQLKELVVRPDYRKRVVAAVAVMIGTQATGATAFAYFGPQYFKLLVGSGQKDLLLTAIFGAVKVAACGAFVILFANRFSRRQVLIGGAAGMAVCQLITAVLVKTKPAPADAHVTSSGIASVAMIYLFVIIYNFSWGPIPWLYVSEIFPSRIRAPGVAIGIATQWLFNFTFSIATPYMMASLGWGTFLLWGAFDLVIAASCFFFLKETNGMSLEAIAHQKYKAGAGTATEAEVVASEKKNVEVEHQV